MMKKSILPILFMFALLSFVSATSITINSLSYSTLNTGNHIVAYVTVTNPNVFQDLRDVTLNWKQPNNPNAWTECSSIWNKINQTSWQWKCILTVTPQMNTSSNVYVTAIARSGNTQVLLGNFDFKGKAFPKLTKVCSNVTACSKRSWDGICLKSKIVYSCKMIMQ